MFKNLALYRVSPEGPLSDLADVEAALSTVPFQPCGATQEQSLGWVPPRGEKHGALIESVDGHWICRIMIETKKVPASAIARRLEERVEAISEETGRKPGKKERKDLKDEIRLSMLPYAIPKLNSVWVWIDATAGLLYIDTVGQSRLDSIVSSLVELLPGLSVANLATKTAPAAAMANWLRTQEAPAGFSVDRECELKSPDESQAAVRYARHSLDISEIRGHIDAGKIPKKLAMTWEDRVSFLLTDTLQLRKIEFLDTVFENNADRGVFDTDMAIATGEIKQLLPNLVEALDGEFTHQPAREENV